MANLATSPLSIREAKDLVEANMYAYDGSVSKLLLIKMLRDETLIAYRQGYHARGRELSNVDEPSQLDRIEAMLIAFIKSTEES